MNAITGRGGVRWPTFSEQSRRERETVERGMTTREQDIDRRAGLRRLALDMGGLQVHQPDPLGWRAPVVQMDNPGDRYRGVETLQPRNSGVEQVRQSILNDVIIVSPEQGSPPDSPVQQQRVIHDELLALPPLLSEFGRLIDEHVEDGNDHRPIVEESGERENENPAPEDGPSEDEQRMHNFLHELRNGALALAFEVDLVLGQNGRNDEQQRDSSDEPD